MLMESSGRAAPADAGRAASAPVAAGSDSGASGGAGAGGGAGTASVSGADGGAGTAGVSVAAGAAETDAPAVSTGTDAGGSASGSAGTGAAGADAVATDLAVIMGAVERLRALAVGTLPGRALLEAAAGVEAVSRSLFGVQVRLAGESESRGLGTEFGCRSTAHLLAERLRITVGDARARIQAATAGLVGLSPTGAPVPPVMPDLVAAIDAGEIGADHARVITDCAAKIPIGVQPALRERCHEVLLHEASGRDAIGLRKVGEQIRLILDADGTEPAPDPADRAELTIGRLRPDGLTPVRGLLDPLTVEQLRAAVDHLSRPTPAGEDLPDRRPAPVRRAQALAEVLHRYLCGGSEDPRTHRSGDRHGGNPPRACDTGEDGTAGAASTGGTAGAASTGGTAGAPGASSTAGAASTGRTAGIAGTVDTASTEVAATGTAAGDQAHRPRRRAGRRFRPQIGITVRLEDLGAGQVCDSSSGADDGTMTGHRQSGWSAARAGDERSDRDGRPSPTQPAPPATRPAPRGTAVFDSGMPVSIETARMLACDGDLIAVVVSAQGAVLDQGRATRVFTRAQRRALTVRDRGCAFPGCDIPASWCDAHHLEPWSSGGRTDLGNAVLLCRRHHRIIHQGAWRIEADREVRARPWFIPPAHLDPLRVPRRNESFFLPDVLGEVS